MTKYLSTPLSTSIHRPGQNPIFGECSTHVTVDDDAGGPFIVLRQCDDNIKPGKVRLDMEELEAVLKAARKLMKAHLKVEKSNGI